MNAGDRIEFRIASGSEWVHHLATVTGPEETRAAPVGWPTSTITTVPVVDVERVDGAPFDGRISRVEASRIIAIDTKEDS